MDQETRPALDEDADADSRFMVTKSLAFRIVLLVCTKNEANSALHQRSMILCSKAAST